MFKTQKGRNQTKRRCTACTRAALHQRELIESTKQTQLIEKKKTRWLIFENRIELNLENWSLLLPGCLSKIRWKIINNCEDKTARETVPEATRNQQRITTPHLETQGSSNDTSVQSLWPSQLYPNVFFTGRKQNRQNFIWKMASVAACNEQVVFDTFDVQHASNPIDSHSNK